MLNRIRRDFNRAAAAYDLHATLQRQVADMLFHQAENCFPEDAVLLDAGAGTGYFQELARKYAHRWTICQLDSAFNMCKLAAGYASLPEYGHTLTVNAEAEHLPFANASMDGVFSSLMLQWSPDIKRVAQAFHQVLKPGGQCFISTLIPPTLHELGEAFTRSGFPAPITPFASAETLAGRFGESGFSDVSLHQQTIRLYYPSVLALMRSLKGVGAQRKSRPVFLGKKGLERIERHYQQYADEKGLPVTWEVVCLRGKRL